MFIPTSTIYMRASPVKRVESATILATFTTTMTLKPSSTSAKLYGSIGIGAFTFGLNVLANTEADEGPGQDFGFGEATYLYADYGTTIGNGVDLGLHIGHHQGDFSEAFNGVPGDYTDYNVSIGKDGFSFMITSTDLDDAGPDALDNDDIKFVIGYSLDIEL